MLVTKFLSIICILITELGIKFVLTKLVSPEFWLFHKVFSKYGKLCPFMSRKTFQFYISTWKKNSVSRASFGQPEIGVKHFIHQSRNWIDALFGFITFWGDLLELFLKGFFLSVTHKILSLKYKIKNSDFFEICRVFVKSFYLWDSCFK